MACYGQKIKTKGDYDRHYDSIFEKNLIRAKRSSEYVINLELCSIRHMIEGKIVQKWYPTVKCYVLAEIVLFNLIELLFS